MFKALNIISALHPSTLTSSFCRHKISTTPIPHYSLFPIFLFNCLCYFFPKFHLIWPHSSGNKVYRIDCNFPGQILSHLNVNSHVFPNVDAKIDYNGKPHKGTQISCFRDKLESFQETGSVSCFLALAI